MRVVVICLVVIVLVAVLYFSGVGRGLEACMDDCKMSHCMRFSGERMDCMKVDAYKACANVCYGEHGKN